MSRKRRIRPQGHQVNKALAPSTLQLIAGSPRGLQPKRTGLAEAINAAVSRARTAQGISLQMDPLPRDPMDTSTFGPLNPLTPDPIDAVRRDTKRPEPRVFEYDSGWNLPGNGNRETPWQVLRAAADGVSIIRDCIEVRKRHVRSLKWEIAPAKEAVQQAYQQDQSRSQDSIEAEMRDRLLPEINRLREFWRKPWKSNDWRLGQWINAVMEDLLVLDAVAIYPRMSYGGAVLDLETIDGATIKPLLDWRGARPIPPYPAFQQVLYGFPRGEWTASVTQDEQGNQVIDNGYAAGELFYYREWVRTHTPYGFPPVERALMDSRLWLKRSGWLLAEYDDGSTPLTFLETAQAQDGTRLDVHQRRLYEDAINDELAGQMRGRHRMKVLPADWKPHQMTTAPERYRPEYDLFLIKLIAMPFGVTISELGFTEPGGLGSQGWHEGQAEVSGRVGLRPDVEVLSDILNSVSTEFMRMPNELEFRFIDPTGQNDKDSDGVADSQVKSGRITLNDDRRRLGLALYDFPEADMPMIITATGPVFLEGSFERAEQETQAKVEQAKAQAEGVKGKLELEGAKLEDGQTAREEDREFARETREAEAAQPTQAQKMAEIGAFRTWRRRNPEPKRPFLFKSIEPDEWPELLELGPDVVGFGPEWEWVEYIDIEKAARGKPSGLDWMAWNVANPGKQRDAKGRWVRRAGSTIDLLQDAGRAREGTRGPKGESRLPAIGEPSRLGGMESYPGNAYQSRARDAGEPAAPQDLYPLGTAVKHRVHGEVTYHGVDRADASGRTHWIRTSRGDEYMVSSTLTPIDSDESQRVQVAIEQAYGKVMSRKRGKNKDNPYVMLADLREALGDGFARESIDVELDRMIERPNVRLQAELNQKALTSRERAAAVDIAGELRHLISIEQEKKPRKDTVTAAEAERLHHLETKQRGEEVRRRAAIAIDVDETVGNEGSRRAIAERLEGVPPTVREPWEAGGADRDLADAVWAWAGEMGVEPVGRPGQRSRFVTGQHKPIVENMTLEGDVDVITPGYSFEGRVIEPARVIDVPKPRRGSTRRKAAQPDEFTQPDLSGSADPKGEAPIPPDQRWPGWAVDTAIAAAAAPGLMAAVAAGVSVGALVEQFTRWSRNHRHSDPLPDVRTWLAQGTDIKDQLFEDLIPPIRQAHVEGWMVGERSAAAVMDWVREHERSARHAVEISVNWGEWEPGHPEAARLLIEPGGLERLLAQSNVMIRGIAQHRLDAVGKVLGRGLAQGDSPDVIAKALRILVNDPVWAKMTAVTETNRAMSAASVAEYKRGGCWGKGWMTAYDQRVCILCKDNEEMPDGSARVVGIDELFPSGDPWPPAHPRCRCAPIPVFQLSRGY